MQKIWKIISIVPLLSLSLYGVSPMQEISVAKAIVKNANAYNIDSKILFTLIDVESDFEPNAIAVETSKAAAETLKALRSDSIKVTTGRTYHSRLYLVSIFPKRKEDAMYISQLLKSMDFIFDVGLMQINTCNFKQHEATKMFDVDYNIQKGAKILKSCTRLFKDFKNQLECYNRGAGNLRKALKKGKNYAPYYKRFLQKWDFR